ncbi:MAG: TonB-dependent receptor [Raineya sp.]|jgi:hypothetical protein|nr:TonB-dependent receptor [Raineya sp.]
MRKIVYVCLLWIAIILQSFAQEKYTLSGKVKDASSGEELIGATVIIKSLKAGAVTNEYGFYSITVEKGSYELTISYVGFVDIVKKIDLQSNQTLDILLKPEGSEIETIEVVGQEDSPRQNVESTSMGTVQLEMKTLKKMPALLGEVDVLRSLQLTPGVSTVGEGAGGFNVRGGGVDQNLVLLDEAAVYNSSHLFGFFSVFNPDAVKDVKLIKGGIPAQYGGRLASVLDVRMKEGNNQKFTASGGVGTVSSRFAVEAPIIKDKSSFIVAGRRSYADVFLRAFGNENQRQNQLYFYDLTTKANYKINDKNKVYVSGYFGRDVFQFGDAFKINWGNATATVRWNKTFNPKLFANFSGIYSNYDYNLGVPTGTQSFDWASRIETFQGKADFSYFSSPKSIFNFGATALRYNFYPGSIKVGKGSIFNPFTLDRQNALETAIYIDHEHKVSTRLQLQYGLRYSWYNFLGKGTVYDYVGETGKRKTATNPRTFKSYQSIADYGNLEPRFSMRYQFDESSSFKASYNRTSQYIHLISSTTAASPTDVWSPTTNNIKPELADQVAAGYFRNFKNNTFEASAELYYKTMTNQIDYVDGALLLLNKQMEGDLLYGLGRSYGAEFYVKKNSGKLNGWLSYTLSKSERKIDGINNGEWYRAKYDRTHNLSLVLIYDLNEKWSFSSNFNYATGVATTFPNARYEMDGIIVPHNTGNVRNNYRVPAYHRFDLGATYHKKKTGRFEQEWVFSLYNVYGRKNPFTVYFRQEPAQDGQIQAPQNTQARELSIFASIIPSVTWNFKF